MVVSVIIPVFNRAVEIRGAVASVLRQACVLPIDVLIVDDGSDAETQQVLTALAALDSRVRVVRRDNGGAAAARNTGLDNLLPETAFVTFLDSDDLMAPDRFASDLAVLIDSPEIMMTYGDMVITLGLDRDALTIPADAPQFQLTGVHMACCLYRPELITEIGRFDETLEMAEDTDFIFRTFEIGINYCQTKTVCHYYLRHPGNMTVDNKDTAKWFNRALIRSVKRRKTDPTRRLVKPEFNVEFPKEFW